LPCIEPLTGKTSDDRPFCLETFFIDLAKELKITGFGKGAITAADGSAHDLNRAEDFYLRAYANIAAGAKLPEANGDEVAFAERNYPLSRFKGMLPPAEWCQLSYMLVRGGVFNDYEKVFDGETFTRGLERFVLYNETLATTRNSLTGELYPGTLHYMTPSDSSGLPLTEKDSDYPFTVITYKMHVHTQSRTSWHKYALEIFPENKIQLNAEDATRLGFKNGDKVMLESASRPAEIKGTIAVTQTIRPGCIGISFHYGHTQLGAAPLTVKGAEKVFQGGKAVCDGNIVFADSALGAGTNPNMVGRLDDNLAATPLVDVLAGIPDFSSTRVRLKRAG
jgi:tetrathionate reductase subunit A